MERLWLLPRLCLCAAAEYMSISHEITFDTEDGRITCIMRIPIEVSVYCGRSVLIFVSVYLVLLRQCLSLTLYLVRWRSKNDCNPA